MSDLISDGRTRVAWVSSIANINAPTTTELNGGLDLTPRLTPDGLKMDPTTADVDTSSLASTFDTTEVGRIKYDAELTLKRGSTTPEDLAYTTLVYGAHGYLVIRRGLTYATAWASGQQVEVYPVACGERANKAPAANEVMKWMAPLKVTTAPATAAAVA
ncbi:phage tail tube protein [Kitasatospora sp. NPDC004272]